MILKFFGHCALPITLVAAPLCAEEAPGGTFAGWDPAQWDLEDSEFRPEDGWHFGVLDNGLRYIVRRNARPEGTALVRMEIDAGSLDEREDERGFAHFVEHMAFNGSTNVPEGEMIKLLEREGLAFGADTNASTGFDRTQYKLDLPRADAKLLDTALMLMRETASELTFAGEAVEREKGVILSERRVRNNYSLKNTLDGFEFAYPEARLTQRLPIGLPETISAADAAGVRAFWEREYVPADTVVVVVGDFDPADVEALIRARFADWRPAPTAEPATAGPIDPDLGGQTDIYLDPALPETVTLMRHAEWRDRPDTLAERSANLLRTVGNRILARRIQRLTRQENPPFRGAQYAASDVFEAARTGQLAVVTETGRWREGLAAAIAEWRRALEYGFGEAEVAEQVANIRTSFENAAANAATRSNADFVAQAFRIAHGDNVPDSPADTLARFEAQADAITPQAVLAAMREEAIALDNPLIRFTGSVAPEGGEAALRAAVVEDFAAPVAEPETGDATAFAYTDFGTPGRVVADQRSAELGIRTLRFANGVMLNLKRTDLEDDRVWVRMNLDGGKMLESRDDPLAVELAPLLPSGGLGKHSRDELQTILAGRSVGGSFVAGNETFVAGAITTPRDLELQLQFLTASLTDPGYRSEGLGPWRAGLDSFFARLGKTPASALSEGLGPILSDEDPRFTRQPIEAYRALDYAQLRTEIADRLANGALEIAIVGDIDEDAAIAMVARTFGALPQREAEFRDYPGAPRTRGFTADRSLRVLTHEGEADQALVRLVWPTTDNDDWDLTSRLTLLERVARLALTEKLREELGQTYSPSADSSQSSTYEDYGTFSMQAEVDAGQLEEARQAMVETAEALRGGTIDADLVERARRPLIESLDNRLKRNAGWLAVVDRAQSRPEDTARFLGARERQLSITPAELTELARTYLAPEDAVTITVVPEAGS
ncbi:M16 family metallopeptidase [Qipengyuania spongiae]|uniref:Insulinase family protein n=1 Tax=Qipengyuania spongiae TaxID=2909673 RepID=A0ABY5SV37_9SPHN|nr:insulinase family protein [Qipengyuania spongiae]UVI38362.1 insulinase family protein [Qipengyuania spongiae]